MSREILEHGVDEILASVEDCIVKKRFIPSLILLYSTIDIVSGLDRPERKTKASRSDFVTWVDAFLLPGSKLECSAMDLYAARCGIIHTYSSESALTKSGNAKHVFYAWGTGTAEALNFATERTSWKGKAVTIHIDSLVTGFKNGFQRFLSDLSSNVARSARVYSRAGQFFSQLSVDHVQAFLDVTDSSTPTT